jgi:hypothetical protein
MNASFQIHSNPSFIPQSIPDSESSIKIPPPQILTEGENVPSEEVAFEEAWVGCDEVALAWVLVEALVPR